MQQLCLFILALLCPLLSHTQNYYSPLSTYFDSDGTSVYGDMAIDSIDILELYAREVKVRYNENCKVSSINYVDGDSIPDTFSVEFEYHPSGLPKIRRKISEADRNLINYDTTWYNNDGIEIKVHNTNSTGTRDHYKSSIFDNEGRLLKYIYRDLSISDDSYQYIESQQEYVYISDNRIESTESQATYYSLENNPIDSFVTESMTTYHLDDGKIIERISISGNNESAATYKYDGDKILEQVNTYNGSVRSKLIYTYSDVIPECEFWTNDLWEVNQNQEVVTRIYHDKRFGELMPVEEYVEAYNSFGYRIYYHLSFFQSNGEWQTERKSLRHFDENGGRKYSVVFEQWDGGMRPLWLTAYETDARRQITKSESFDFDPVIDTWAPVNSETINTYNDAGDITSRKVTDGDGVDNYTWEYTDFGALSRTTSPLWDSNFYYTEQCNQPKPTSEEPLVYPNPVSDILTIAHVDPEDDLTARIFNVAGALVMDFSSMSNGQLDVSSLSSGIYLLRYNTDRTYQQLKFIKI